jgi:Methionyl-tRNA formyltransferase
LNNNSYVVASVKKWHKYEFEKIKKKLRGNWYFFEDYGDLTLQNLEKINPSYIFFPHWSKKVPKEIFNKFECICFHETDLPFGKGGSPIQNLISNGFDKTKISALKMIEDLDSGPIYLKTNLSLEGLAEEIYIRSAKLVSK